MKLLGRFLRAAGMGCLPAAVIVWSGAALAAGLDVYPLGLALSPQTLRDSINLTNTAEAPVVVQAQVFRWTQDARENLMEKTDDLIVVPPVFTLEPGAKQVLRVGFRRPPAAGQELGYRLILTQVPDEASGTGAVAVALRLSLPVFYAPFNAKPAAEWSFAAGAPGELHVTLRNIGAAHYKVREIAVATPADPDKPLASDANFKYVLPGVTRQWLLKTGDIAAGTPLLLSARTKQETLEQEFAMPAQ